MKACYFQADSPINSLLLMNIILIVVVVLCVCVCNMYEGHLYLQQINTHPHALPMHIQTLGRQGQLAPSL